MAKPRRKKKAEPPRRRWARWFVAAAGILLLVWVVYGQTARFGFVSFDDDRYVHDEPMVARGLSGEGVAWAFTRVHAGNWHPLTSLSLMLDVELFGVNAGAHHLVNVFLHALTTLLLLAALHRLTGAFWRSALVAALFALHPVKAESVAWISERKDVLSGLFFVLALLAYDHFARAPLLRRYLLLLLAAALGLLAKPMLVTLPLILLLLDFWPMRRWADREPGPYPARSASRLFLEKVPLLALAAGSAAATWWAQARALGAGASISFTDRLANAAVTPVIYLKQTLWPTGLAAFYPHPQGELPVWWALLALALLACVTLAGWHYRRVAPFLLTGWGWFLVMLLPVLGLIQVGWQARADRYLYLPQIGLTIAIVWLAELGLRRLAAGRALGWSLGLVAIASCTVLAQRQVATWRDSETLWRRALAVTQNNDMAHRGLGIALAHDGKLEEARAELERAVALRPGNADTRVNLANVYRKQGETARAVALYREILREDPGHWHARRNLAGTLAEAGRIPEATEEYLRLQREHPEDPDLAASLGALYLQTGNTAEAARFFRAALALRPGQAEALNNLGIALFREGRVGEAVESWREAAGLQPGNSDLQNNLGVALATLGREEEAITHWSRALALAPRASTQLTLAWVLATSARADLRDGARAVELAQAALRGMGEQNAMALRTLAAARAETGDFDGALAAAREARALAEAQGEERPFPSPGGRTLPVRAPAAAARKRAFLLEAHRRSRF